MFPLMRTTWIINRRLLFQFSPWLAFYLWMLVKAQASGEPLQMAAVLIGFAILLTTIVTLQGLLLPVEDFLLSLPVSRAQLVRAKYLSSLLGLGAGLALPLLVASLAHGVVPSRVPAISTEVLGIGGLAALHLAFGIFFFLPFVYQFGPAKGLTFFAMTLVLFLACAVAWKGRWACTKAMVDFSNHILEGGPFAWGATVGVLVVGLASLGVSLWAYQPKVSQVH